MRLRLAGVAIAFAVLITSTQAAFLDYYSDGGATEVARWEFNGPDGAYPGAYPPSGGGYADFPPSGLIIGDAVGANSLLYNNTAPHGGNYNLPVGGVLDVSDNSYYYAYPTGQGEGNELKNAIAGADSSFSYYMRYKFDDAAGGYFTLMAKSSPAWLFHYGDGGTLEMRVTAASNGALNRVNTDIDASSFSDGYHDVLATYDGTTGQIAIYLDGVNRGVDVDHANGLGVQDSVDNFDLFAVQIGGAVEGLVNPSYGLLVDEVRVYDGVVDALNVIPEPATVVLTSLLGFCCLACGRWSVDRCRQSA